VVIAEYHRSFLHAKVAVIDDRWATVGSSNIDPYSLLMAREANIVVRDARFADQLRLALIDMIDTGTRHIEPRRWATRSVLAKAAAWIAYGMVRVGMGLMGYGGQEFFPRRSRRVQATAQADAPPP
jgi:cardiolipin synthase